MKNTLRILLFCCVTIVSGQLHAQNTEMDPHMKAWTAYMTPGNEHMQLAKAVGDWKGSTKMWMDEGQEPMVMDSRVQCEMALGGRYLTARYTGQMMGMPFEGISTMGYDNAAKKYVSSWVDNMGTGLMYMEGRWRDDVKGIEIKGMAVDPMTGKEMKVRQIMMMKDANTQVIEMYMDMNGKEMKSMEITLTRM